MLSPRGMVLGWDWIGYALPGGGALTYKNDGGVRLPTHQIKGLSVIIFLQKRGSLGDRSEKGWSLGVKLHKIRAILTICKKFLLRFANFSKIWWYRWKILIETAKIGVIWCKVVKKGAFGVQAMQKRWSIDMRMSYTGQWECPPPPGLSRFICWCVLSNAILHYLTIGLDTAREIKHVCKFNFRLIGQ